MNKRFWSAAVLFFFLWGCVASPDAIRDVRDLRQDHAAYFTAAAGEERLPAAGQARLDEDCNTITLSVWHQSEPFHALPERVKQDFRK